MQRLAAQGSLPLDFYPSFIARRRSGVGLRGRRRPAALLAGVLGRAAAHRRARRDALVEAVPGPRADHAPQRSSTLLDWPRPNGARVARGGARGRRARRRARRHPASRCAIEATDHVRADRLPRLRLSRASRRRSRAALVTRYDPSTPQIWRVPLLDEVAPAVTVEAPRGGYVVPAAHAALVAEKLALHGIESRRAAAPRCRRLAVADVPRDEGDAGARPPSRAAPRPRSTATWAAETRDVPAGSLFVPIAQPNAWLLMTLLEPAGPDSLGRAGASSTPPSSARNTWRPTWRSSGRARRWPRTPALRQAFEKRLAEDPAFARESGGAARLLLPPPPGLRRAPQPLSGLPHGDGRCRESRAEKDASHASCRARGRGAARGGAARRSPSIAPAPQPAPRRRSRVRLAPGAATGRSTAGCSC